MIKYIGPQLNSAIIAANNEEYSLEEQFIKYIDLQAFAVLPLKGQTFTVDSDEKLSQGLEAFLFCLFPGIDWTDVDVSPGPVRKYNFLHTSIPAPENEATHQPMSIEIRGGIKDLSGDPGTYAGALSEIWPLESEESHSRWRQIRREYSLEDELPKLIGRLTLEIWEAVYSIFDVSECYRWRLFIEFSDCDRHAKTDKKLYKNIAYQMNRHGQR